MKTRTLFKAKLSKTILKRTAISAKSRMEHVYTATLGIAGTVSM
jgi:hypothetical protein